MTVCLGALCSDRDGHSSKAVVVGADRMVTLGGHTEFEHEVPKIMAVTDRVVALIAGDALKGGSLIRDIASQMPAGAMSVKAVADAISVRYTQLRQQQIQSDIFTPRGISMAQFYGGLQQQMLPQIVAGIDNHVASYNFGVDILIAGVDDSGASLFSLTNPGGTLNDFQQIAYTAIGSGALHALQSMIGFGHMGGRSLHETAFSVYASKRRGEVAPGVGKDTDLFIVTANGITRLPDSVKTELESAYSEYQRPLAEEVREKLAKIKLFETEGEADVQPQPEP